MIPKRFIGENIIHLPTVKTHIFTTTTGAMKNAFGGLLNEHRHWTHPVIHETLVDLLMIQKKIHRGVFAVMDGTFAGDGPGPRCMMPHVKNVILASADQVAIDAVAAKLMGIDPMSIKFIRLAHDLGLGCGDPRDIEIVGDLEAAKENWHFDGPFRKMTFASRMQHRIYWGPLKKPIEWSLKTVLAPWAYMASVVYHDSFWYPVKARYMMEQVLDSEWGRLFRNWETLTPDAKGFPDRRHRCRGRSSATGLEGVHQVDRHPRHVHQGSAGVRQPQAQGRGPRAGSALALTGAASPRAQIDGDPGVLPLADHDVVAALDHPRTAKDHAPNAGGQREMVEGRPADGCAVDDDVHLRLRQHAERAVRDGHRDRPHPPGLDRHAFGRAEPGPVARKDDVVRSGREEHGGLLRGADRRAVDRQLQFDWRLDADPSREGARTRPAAAGRASATTSSEPATEPRRRLLRSHSSGPPAQAGSGRQRPEPRASRAAQSSARIAPAAGRRALARRDSCRQAPGRGLPAAPGRRVDDRPAPTDERPGPGLHRAHPRTDPRGTRGEPNPGPPRRRS